MRKAFALIETPIAIPLLLIFILIIGGIIIANSGGLEGLRSGACERYAFLPFCGGQQGNITTAEFVKARHSLLSAACAANSVNSGKEGACVKDLNGAAKAEGYDTSITCNAVSGKFSCNVNNFTLPQYNANNKFIQGHGDPQFLAYWSSFPDGIEGSWSSLTPAGLSMTTAVIGYMSVGSVLRFGAAGKYIYIPLLIRETLLLDQVGALRPAARSIAALITPQLSPEARGIIGDTSDAAMVVAKYIESKQGKYVPKGTSLALKSPYRPPEYFSLSSDNPVLFRYDNFFAVSPCTAKLGMKKSIIECEAYSYNSDAGSVKCENPSEADTMNPLNSCRGTEISTNRMVFSKGDFMPVRLQQLLEGSNREEVFLYEEIGQNMFVVTDTATGISFTFRPVLMDASYPTNFLLSEISATADGQRKYFIILDGKYEDRYIGISASGSCEWKGDLAGEASEDPPHLECSFSEDPSAVKKSEGCAACDKVAEHLGKMKDIRFRRLKVIVVDEDGKRTENWLNKFGFLYSDSLGSYYLIYYDANKDAYAETLGVARGREEGTRVMDAASVESIPRLSLLFMDTPGLTDGRLDHKFETVTISGCRTGAVMAEMQRERTGMANFCFPERSWRSTIPYLPEAGAAAGTIGGLFGVIPGGAWGGFKWGFKAGSVAVGVLQLGMALGYVEPDPDQWPGQSY